MSRCAILVVFRSFCEHLTAPMLPELFPLPAGAHLRQYANKSNFSALPCVLWRSVNVPS